MKKGNTHKKMIDKLSEDEVWAIVERLRVWARKAENQASYARHKSYMEWARESTDPHTSARAAFRWIREAPPWSQSSALPGGGGVCDRQGEAELQARSWHKLLGPGAEQRGVHRVAL